MAVNREGGGGYVYKFYTLTLSSGVSQVKLNGQIAHQHVVQNRPKRVALTADQRHRVVGTAGKK